MARIAKIDNVTKKRFERKEKKRAVSTKTRKVYFLIVCEGEKTEPNYFQALKDSLPDRTVLVTDMTIKGTGKNTISLVDFTIKHRDAHLQKFDRVWVVFDKDSFTDDQFNTAIAKAENNGIQVAWSNEAFEIWFLLHFEYVNHAMPREDYQKGLERSIDKARGVPGYTYKKNAQDTFDLINSLGSQNQAIGWAKKISKLHEGSKFAKHNPCTTVYLLIEELNDPESVLKIVEEGR